MILNYKYFGTKIGTRKILDYRRVIYISNLPFQSGDPSKEFFVFLFNPNISPKKEIFSSDFDIFDLSFSQVLDLLFI